MTSAIQKRLDIADFSNPKDITLIKSIDMTTYGGITSVAVKNDVVAVASPNINEQLDGQVIFFKTNGDFISKVTVGALPDMITFTPDGKKVLTANEGQPNLDYSIDPEGSISVIDISGGAANLTQANVKTIDFKSWNAGEADLKAKGVRKLYALSTIAQDFEPEYITVAPDNIKAWVTLQENNAIAELDLSNNSVSAIWAMGTKNMNTPGNGLDASDKSGSVLIANWPIKSFYIPDGIANYTVNNKTYLITANEGDEKEYTPLNERTTVSAITLDATKFPQGEMLKEDHALGRFRITNLHGDTDGDGDFDELFSVGCRSFSIWDPSSKSLVWDAGDQFEWITSKHPAVSRIFNADNENNTLKGRSRAKGPEPEGVTVAEINGKHFAFVALERTGGVMVYDVTNPSSPVFEDYQNTRSNTAYTGDLGPEGIQYINNANSPTGKPYVIVANELSGTITVFEVINNTLVSDITELTNIENPLLVYPNPAMNRIYVQCTGEVVVTDMVGKVVYNGCPNDQGIDLSDVPKGVYLVKDHQGRTAKVVLK
jgi:DNA-binding beta-propeller fold protein YncE